MPFSSLKSNNSHPLRNLPHSLNIFTPKSKQGHWSAIVETETGRADGFEKLSDRAILCQEVGFELEHRGGVEGGRLGITKKTEVEVSYGQAI